MMKAEPEKGKHSLLSPKKYDREQNRLGWTLKMKGSCLHLIWQRKKRQFKAHRENGARQRDRLKNLFLVYCSIQVLVNPFWAGS